MKKNNSLKLYICLLIVIVSFIIIELTIRSTISRGKRFYVLREVTFNLPEVETIDEKIDILCLGGSASNGMGLKDLKNRYSELLAVSIPEFNIINDSNTGIPLSEVNFYLYNYLQINTVNNCIIFSGNNEYLELLNRNEHGSFTLFIIRYSFPKVFSIISSFSHTIHNIVNIAYNKISHSNNSPKAPFAIIKGGGKDSWPYLNKFCISLQNIFYRMRLLELRSIIKAHPQTNFIYVIPPINYTHNWNHMNKYDQLDIKMPKDTKSTRNILEKHWIKRRFLVTPKLQTMIKKSLNNLGNVEIFDLDKHFLSQVNNNPADTQKFFLDYCHLNELGHSLLAARLEKMIKNNNLH